MVNQHSIPLYQALLQAYEERFSGSRASEPDAIHKLRQNAFQTFQELGFPTTKVEDWKYTNVTPFLRENYTLSTTPQATATELEQAQQAAAIPGMDCYTLVLHNGQLQPALDTNQVPAFLKVISIEEAMQEPSFQKHFGKIVDAGKHHFAALNTAMFTGGLFLEIDTNSHLDKPLHIIHTYSSADNLFTQPRNLFVVNRSASLSIIESVVALGNGATVFVNGLTEVAVAENANVQHYTLQTAHEQLRNLQHTEVSQKRDSVYSGYTFSLPSAQLLRNNLHINLDDEHTETHLYGLYLANSKQLVDNHTFMNHRFANCESNEVYKGVLLDNAVGVFNGKVYVHQDAQKTNAFQQNNNLLLSPKAVINSKPQLEIFADDVKCSHGTTIGQLSQEAMFYLQSRGIGEDAARAMLVTAFAFDVTENIRIPALEEHINKLITQHIPAKQELVNV